MSGTPTALHPQEQQSALEGKIAALAQKGAENPALLEALAGAIGERRMIDDRLIARQLITEAEMAREEKKKREQLSRQQRQRRKELSDLLAARLQLIKEIERHLRAIARLLAEAETKTKDIRGLYQSLQGPDFMIDPLSPMALGARLSEFCYGLGLAQWLPVLCSEMRKPPHSLAAPEAEAQAAYLLSQDDQ